MCIRDRCNKIRLQMKWLKKKKVIDATILTGQCSRRSGFHPSHPYHSIWLSIPVKEHSIHNQGMLHSDHQQNSAADFGLGTCLGPKCWGEYYLKQEIDRLTYTKTLNFDNHFLDNITKSFKMGCFTLQDCRFIFINEIFNVDYSNKFCAV